MLTAAVIVLAFALCWGVVWIWAGMTESLSWLLWWTVATPVVFMTEHSRFDRGAKAGIVVAAVAVGLAALFWVVGGFGYGEWGSDRGDPAFFLSLLPYVLLFAVVSAPFAHGVTRLHPRLMAALGAVVLGQAVFAALTLVFPDPRVVEDGIYSKDSIVTSHRVLIVVLGAAGALLLICAGRVLRRHVPPWTTWSAAGAFLLTAVIYQAWYPPFSTFGD